MIEVGEKELFFSMGLTFGIFLGFGFAIAMHEIALRRVLARPTKKEVTKHIIEAIKNNNPYYTSLIKK